MIELCWKPLLYGVAYVITHEGDNHARAGDSLVEKSLHDCALSREGRAASTQQHRKCTSSNWTELLRRSKILHSSIHEHRAQILRLTFFVQCDQITVTADPTSLRDVRCSSTSGDRKRKMLEINQALRMVRYRCSATPAGPYSSLIGSTTSFVLSTWECGHITGQLCNTICSRSVFGRRFLWRTKC